MFDNVSQEVKALVELGVAGLFVLEILLVAGMLYVVWQIVTRDRAGLQSREETSQSQINLMMEQTKGLGRLATAMEHKADEESRQREALIQLVEQVRGSAGTNTTLQHDIEEMDKTLETSLAELSGRMSRLPRETAEAVAEHLKPLLPELQSLKRQMMERIDVMIAEVKGIIREEQM